MLGPPGWAGAGPGRAGPAAVAASHWRGPAAAAPGGGWSEREAAGSDSAAAARMIMIATARAVLYDHADKESQSQPAPVRRETRKVGLVAARLPGTDLESRTRSQVPLFLSYAACHMPVQTFFISLVDLLYPCNKQT